MNFTGNEIQRAHLYYFSLGLIVFLSCVLSTIMITGKVALIIGILWLVLTTPIYFTIRKKQKGLVLYSILNAIIAGVVMGSYYSIKGVSVYNFIIILCIWAIIMLLNYRVVIRRKSKEKGMKIPIIVRVLALIFSIVVWIGFSASLGSALTFISILVLCIDISYALNKNRIDVMQVIGLASLLMFVGILVCVVVVLSEGEVLDLSIFEFGNRKKKIT